jgi:hypothetical protein
MPNVVKIGGGVLGALKKQIKDAKPLSKAEAKANKRGLKAANKPLSKGNAKAPFKGGMSGSVLKNTPPARPNRERGGSLRTLRKQGKTTATAPAVKSSPKSGLENRGAKPTSRERINRARDLQWDKMEKNYDAYLPAVGLRGGPAAKAQGPKGKNARARAAIEKEASKKMPIKINSQRNLKKKGK